MSQDAPASNRKEKKAQRDADRQKGSKKRKRDDAEEKQDAPNNELQKDFIPLSGEGGDDGARTNGADAPDVDRVVDAKPSKSKKRKKVKHDKAQDDAAGEGIVVPDKSGKNRFILFIGNLPYATTDAGLETHFKKISPFTLRHRTDPKTKKSKGFAFLEFENYDRMKTCLKLYHHSMFDASGEHAGANGQVDDKKLKKRKDKGARRINVELTAGGGGKAEGRKEKIKAKNVKLDEQRRRRAEVERKEKEEERQSKKANGDAKAAPKNEAKDSQNGTQDGAAQVHPSRLARIKQ